MKNLKILSLVLIFAVLFSNCKKEEPEDPNTSTSTTEGVIVLEGSGLNNLASYSSSTGEIKFKNPVDYVVGNILTSSQICEEVPNGFLRKISSISEDKKKIQTQQATFEEAVEEGFLDVTRILLPEKNSKWDLEPGVEILEQTKFGFGFNFKDYVLCDQVVLNGFIEFNYAIRIKIEVKKWKLKSFIFKNEVDENSKLIISSTLSSSFITSEKVVASHSFSPIFLGMLGLVPVWVTPSLEIVAGSDGTFSICYANVSNFLCAEAGIKYEDSNWNLISDFSNDFGFENPSLNFNLDFITYAGPRLNLLLYDVAGSYGFVKSYLNLEVHNKTIYWYLDGGLNVDAGIIVKVLSKTLVNQSHTIIQYEEELASGQISGGNTPPTAFFTVNPVSGQPGTTFNFDASGSSDLEDPLSALQFRWDPSGDGIWDTDWSSEYVFAHQYIGQGIFNVGLQVKDSEEATDEYFKEVYVGVGGGEPCPGIPTVTYEGQVYNTVLIGTQCWLKENLNVGTMINGSQNQTNNSIIEKYCYDDDLTNCGTYGGLYQWDEMMQYTTTQGAQGICPNGWHLPTDEEWKVLEGTVDSQYGVGDPEWDGTGNRGYDAGKNLKSTTGWHYGGNGTNDFGFTILPSGYRSTEGSFDYLIDYTNFWSSSESSLDNAWARHLNYSSNGIYRISYLDKIYGFSVRCLQDN